MLQEQIFMCQKPLFGVRSAPSQVASPQEQTPHHTSLFEYHDAHRSSKLIPERDFLSAAAVPMSPVRSSTKSNCQNYLQKKSHGTRKTNKKLKQKFSSMVIYAELFNIIQHTGSPDVVAILEARIDVKKLLSLPGFQDWCREQKYNHVFMS